MVPITKRASFPNKQCGINNKPKLIRSMLAAGIVQDTLLEKLEKAKEVKRKRQNTQTISCLHTYFSLAPLNRQILVKVFAMYWCKDLLFSQLR